VTAYSRILASGQESGTLYYNLGNCYYKLGDIGRAVLFYERARRRMPEDEDIRTNLALAGLATVDKIEPQPVFLPVRLVNGFIHWIPKSRLVNLVLALQALSVFSFAAWAAARKPALRRPALRLGISLACLTVLFGFALAGQIRESRIRRDAVILAARVDVLSAPGAEGVEVFSLHAGTRVQTDQQTEEWVEIVLPDRKVGWVKKEVLEWI
jgi:hypothetical protein